MPEGPELSKTSYTLNSILSGKKLIKVLYLMEKYATLNIPEDVTVISVKCKGKQMYWTLSNGTYLFISLGMSGKFSLNPEKHAHIKFIFENDPPIYFVDVRRFGRLSIENDLKKLDTIAKPINEDDPGFLYNMRKYQNKHLVEILMDQHKVCSGVGNYILSEVLYRRCLHPLIKIKDISDEDLVLLQKELNLIFKESFAKGGMSMRDYEDITGKGSYQNHLKVYGRKTTESGEIVYQMTGPHKRTIHYVRRQLEPVIEIVFFD